MLQKWRVEEKTEVKERDELKLKKRRRK
jgi:hypothetical protein